MNMDGDTIVRPVDCLEWKSLYPQFHDANYRQMWEYTNLVSAAYGSVIEHRAIEWKGSVVGLAAVRLKTLPVFRTGLAYLSGGPLTRKLSVVDSTDMFRISLRALQAEYSLHRRMTLRLQPPLGTERWAQRIGHAAMVELGFHQARWPKPYRTIIVQLDRDIHAIRLAFHQKWRNCLNRAERGGIQVKWGTTEESFNQFTPLLHSLEHRKGFHSAVDPDMLMKINNSTKYDRDAFHVGLAIMDGRAIAGIVLSIQGDTGIYLLGASLDQGRKLMASYLLQWHGILLAKEKGAVMYDLGGIDPDENPGVHRFKSRMGGITRVAVGPLEIWPNKVKGRLVDVAEHVYRHRNAH